jgi:hypothetical protein
MHHWSSSDFAPRTVDPPTAAPFVATNAKPTPLPRRSRVFRLTVAGLGLIALAAALGLLPAAVGIAAGAAVVVATVMRWGFWVLENVAEF